MLWKLFAAALAVRWIYALVLFATIGESGLQTPDSITYLANAHELAQAIHAGTLHGAQWLESNTVTMPLFAWLIGLHALLFGKMATFAYVLTQGVLDSVTCLLIYYIAQNLNPRIAVPSAIAAVLNPTQIVLTGLVYTDAPFLFFVALFLLTAVRWLNSPSWRWATLCGIGLGAAAMIRILAAPWAAFLVLFLLIAAIIHGHLTRRTVFQLALTATIVALSIAPVLWPNITQYGAWSLTSQSGMHLAYWIVPLVNEARNGIPWPAGYEQMQEEVRKRFPSVSDNPFEQSRRYEIVAREKLAELGFVPIAKAWIFGAAINIASPAIILSPPILKLPRTGFYATAGNSSFEKVSNFLFHSESALYTWILLCGIAGVAAVRLIQLWGILDMMLAGGNWPVLLLFAGWIGFILAVNGPLASPKYRLPMEPILAVLTGAGIYGVRRRWTSEAYLKIQAAQPLLDRQTHANH